jgi:hypothetical protein
MEHEGSLPYTEFLAAKYFLDVAESNLQPFSLGYILILFSHVRQY